ncbi:hypothetical protein [Streptomyces canus]|uniref:hypothetical protein n=1 Tax=Streptomyces canus TaxID=58343 RepID=UPI0032462D75
MHLLHQRGPLHDLPDTPEAYDAVLADVVEQALARLTPEGNVRAGLASPHFTGADAQLVGKLLLSG